jgi:hypothetical protein
MIKTKPCTQKQAPFARGVLTVERLREIKRLLHFADKKTLDFYDRAEKVIRNCGMVVIELERTAPPMLGQTFFRKNKSKRVQIRIVYE